MNDEEPGRSENQEPAAFTWNGIPMHKERLWRKTFTLFNLHLPPDS
jgi:hypothetical protein